MPKHRSQHLEKVFVPKPIKPPSTRLVSLIDARIYVTGMYSGQEYIFEGCGVRFGVDIDNRDVEWMLEKRQGERQCCGGTEKGNRIFALEE